MDGIVRWCRACLPLTGLALILASLWLAGATGPPLWCGIIGILLILANSVIPFDAEKPAATTDLKRWRFRSSRTLLDAMSAPTGTLSPESASSEGPDVQSSEQQRLRQEAFEELRLATAREFEEQEERLSHRERQLTERFARYNEILEYPVPDVQTDRTPGELTRLSAQDREVSRILEAEAERVYEKIRTNGYTVSGKLDVPAIRSEVFELVQRIARVYSPSSTSPLLETSFEQLARAASRICLHVLVLVEQLPMNVQQYNFNHLYGYFRKAVVGYGAYQQAAPWLSYLTRGLYAGRLAAGSNPVSLGAWWVATEAGKKGAQKFVEKVIDRQAIAILHDLITVVGVEVACVYGTGFRYRDPAWILGTELIELISRFPPSRESLRAGLKQITELRLRNEYDRIYLYRCLASHKSAVQRLPDPSMLTREEREHIATSLESFFSAHIHGTTATEVDKWRHDVEERLDLKLRPMPGHAAASHPEQSLTAVVQLAVFLKSLGGLEDSAVVSELRRSKVLAMLATDDIQPTLETLPETIRDTRFEPPGLDPASPVTAAFLEDLVSGVVRLECSHQSEFSSEHGQPAQLNSGTAKKTAESSATSINPLETLAAEVCTYFRRSAKETTAMFDQAWLSELKGCSANNHLHHDMTTAVARCVLQLRQYNESVAFTYPETAIQSGDQTVLQPHTWLVGFVVRTGSATSDHAETSIAGRAVLVTVHSDQTSSVLWTSTAPLQVTRRKGLLIDSAIVTGGTWTGSAQVSDVDTAGPTRSIVISGSLRGGRYSTYFEPLNSFR